MHRSRLVGLLIVTPAAHVGAEVGFWTAALGVPAVPSPGEEQSTVLTGRTPGGHLLCVIPVHSDPETLTSSARTWP
jgi:hypothetical protein